MSAIHPLADVQSKNIGEGTCVWQFTVILKKAIIGTNCNINCNCFIENDVRIGNNVTVKSGVQIWDGLTIEDDVFIGPNVTFTNDHVPRSKAYQSAVGRTLICIGASIGANATIIAGIQVGMYSFIGAGSVVTRNIPPFTLWYGNPARQTGYVTKEGVLLDLDFFDKVKGVQYKMDGDKLIVK